MKALLGFLGNAAGRARRAGLERQLSAVRDAVDAALLRLDAPLLSARAGDRRIRGFLRHRSFLAEIERGDYEPALRRLIVEGAREGSLFVDVGAHVGYYSVLAARAGADVIAVEPDPYNYAALRKNVHGLQVDAHPAAVADAVGRASFHPSGSTTGSSLFARRDIPLLRSIDVPTTTVDALVAGRLDRPIVLKLDVEGAEPLALAGAVDVLTRSERLAVIAEVNPAALAANGYAIDDVTRPLGDFDLVFVDQGGRIGPVPPTPAKGNLVARRPADAR
jgi:FkbM family methyltransferase